MHVLVAKVRGRKLGASSIPKRGTGKATGDPPLSYMDWVKKSSWEGAVEAVEDAEDIN